MILEKERKTTANSSHPPFGHCSQNEIFSLEIFFSTFDKIVVQNPEQRVAAKRYKQP